MAPFMCYSVVQQQSVFTFALWSRNPRRRVPCASQYAINTFPVEYKVLNFFSMETVMCFHSSDATINVSVKWQTHVLLLVMIWPRDSEIVHRVLQWTLRAGWSAVHWQTIELQELQECSFHNIKDKLWRFHLWYMLYWVRIDVCMCQTERQRKSGVASQQLLWEQPPDLTPMDFFFWGHINDQVTPQRSLMYKTWRNTQSVLWKKYH